MPIYIILILAGIVVALIINFMPKKTNPLLEEEETIPETIDEPVTTPEPTPDEVPYPKVDLPLPTGEAKSMKAQLKKKTDKKIVSNKK
jgi:hypothetical protein